MAHSSKQRNLVILFLRFFKCLISSKLRYLFRTSAPISVYISYFISYTLAPKKNKIDLTVNEITNNKKELSFSNAWLSNQSSQYWLMAFDEYKFYEKKINVLEIGSWEGLSSYFILNTLPNAHLTCVDTWAGADEHKGKEVLNNIENNFDSNLSIFKDRLYKFKGTSFNYFNTKNEKDRDQFDFIYIDGSHYCDDVIMDAIKGYELLKVGGIMIFDDYYWRSYKRTNDNPAAAINAFLKLKKGTYKVVRVYYQIIIEKTSSSPRDQWD